MAESAPQASPWTYGDLPLQSSTGEGLENCWQGTKLGEEVYILEGAYYDAQGRVLAGPGTFMFNAPGARHGGISCGLTLYIHCCSGEPDEIVSIDLIDFEPKEKPPSLAGQVPDLVQGTPQAQANLD
jgi:hypothetical protein